MTSSYSFSCQKVTIHFVKEIGIKVGILLSHQSDDTAEIFAA